MYKVKWKIVVLVMALMIGSLAGVIMAEDLEAYEPDPDKVYDVSVANYQVAPVDDDPVILEHWKEKFNIDFEIKNIERAKYDEILGLRLATGEIPDLFQVRSFVNLLKYKNQDLMASFSPEVLEKYAPTMYNQYQTEYPDALDYVTYDGKLIGLPQINSNKWFRSPVVYRGDWMENVGIEEYPETLEELETLVYKFTKEDPDGNGKDDTYGLSASGFQLIFGAFGYLPYTYVTSFVVPEEEYWYERDGKMVFGAVQPEMKQALKILRKWYQDGVIDPEFITGESSGGYWAVSDAFMQGRIGLTTRGYFYHWNPPLTEKAKEQDKGGAAYNQFKNNFPEAVEQLVHGVPVTGPEGKNGVRKPAVYGIFKVFGKQLENEPQKIAKVLQLWEYFSSDLENYWSEANGIKGKHWFINERGLPQLYDKYADQDEWVARNGGKGVLRQPMVSDKLRWAAMRISGTTQWAKENNFLKGKGLHTELYMPLPSEPKYLAELQKLRDEAYISIIAGDKPLSYFDEFVQKWYKLGGKQLEKEANEWYNEVKGN